MKRKGISLLMDQVKRLQIEAGLFEFQIMGIEQFIWALDYHTVVALACTSKLINKICVPFKEIKAPPKRRAIWLAREYRKLYEEQISQKEYDSFAMKLFTTQQFIDFGLGELAPSGLTKTRVLDTLRLMGKKTSILECLDQTETIDISTRLDSLKETKLPSHLMALTHPLPYSICTELAFQGHSAYHIAELKDVKVMACPVFSNWKSLDEINLKSFIEYQRNVCIPAPYWWKSGHEILDMIYNQPGFAVLSAIKRWRGKFLDFVERCRIDYTPNDFIKLKLDVRDFYMHDVCNVPKVFAREPPLWVWQTLFPHKNLTYVNPVLQKLIIPGGLVDNYFK
jgi:hypothetical protein